MISILPIFRIHHIYNDNHATLTSPSTSWTDFPVHTPVCSFFMSSSASGLFLHCGEACLLGSSVRRSTLRKWGWGFLYFMVFCRVHWGIKPYYFRVSTMLSISISSSSRLTDLTSIFILRSWIVSVFHVVFMYHLLRNCTIAERQLIVNIFIVFIVIFSHTLFRVIWSFWHNFVHILSFPLENPNIF
jgi:hypothetical protein